MILVAIWEDNNGIYSRPVQYKDELKLLKHNNKKPSKMIITHEQVKKIGIHKLRNMVSFTGLIMPADGDLSQPIYDGRKKDNVRIKFT